MGIDIRLPNITGTTDREKLTQMQGYLFQLVEQLNWALQNIDTTNVAVATSSKVSQPTSGITTAGSQASVADPQVTFNSIKSLIIKSADIVDAYYQEVSRRLEGLYVAQSDFGDYVERTSQVIEETSTSTTQRFENIQIIITNQGGEIESVKGGLQTIGEDLSYTQNDIFTINSNIEALDGSIASVEGAVGSLDEELQSSKQELQGTVAAAKEELTGSINNTKDELLGTVSNTKTELEGSIDSTKTELSGSIDAAKNELTGSINSTKSELEGTIDSTKEELEGGIKDANGRIDNTNKTVDSHDQMLGTATGQIKDLQDGLNTAKDDIYDAIQAVQDGITGEGGVSSLLDAAKNQLQGSLNDLSAYVDGLKNVIIGVTAYVKSGLLYSTDAGIPVYGLEIGQSVRDEAAGTDVFNKYARFTSEKLSFYDSNGNEVAYISDKKLYINQTEIYSKENKPGAFQIGGLIDLVMANGDVVTKWVGIGG